MQRFRSAEPGKARALALAAIRETFEETGLLLGTARGSVPTVPDGPWSAFAQTQACCPISRDLHFIGRAITPPGRPRRFDARFFTMDAQRDRAPDRGRGRAGRRAGGARLDAARRGQAARHAGRHQVMLEELRSPHRRRASATTCRCRSTA